MKFSIKTVHTLLVVFVALLITASCKEEVTPEQKELSDKITEYEALKKEAMEVHDIVMPKMGALMEFKGKFEAQTTDSIENNEFSIAQNKLQEAHDGMMEWMRDYNEKFPYGEEAPATLEAINEKMPVLKQEVEEIKDLRNRTDKILDYSAELLEETEKKVAA